MIYEWTNSTSLNTFILKAKFVSSPNKLVSYSLTAFLIYIYINNKPNHTYQTLVKR